MQYQGSCQWYLGTSRRCPPPPAASAGQEEAMTPPREGTFKEGQKVLVKMVVHFVDQGGSSLLVKAIQCFVRNPISTVWVNWNEVRPLRAKRRKTWEIK